MRRTDDETRERIRGLLREGRTNRSIAEATGVSTATVSRERSVLTASASVPFSGATQGTALVPVPAWNADQAPPPQLPLRYEPRYHGHTFRAPAAPASIGGWTLERIRNAIDLHDQGIFFESSLLAIVASRFGPVHAALGQAIAPALALPRHVRGGHSALGVLLRAQVEAQIAPRAGLLPSPYFPPWLWGSMQIDLAQMGFAVLQHAYGDPDPETGVRPIYTRRWPTWATQYYRYRRTFVAITTDGPVDIISGDGKFTLIGDTEEPHFDGAIRAAGLEVLDGALVKQARASYVDRYGNPKWAATMPPNVSTRSKEGDDFFDALRVIQGPDGYGAFPHGSKYEVVQMTSSQSTVFKDALDNIWQYVAAIYLGSDGTMTRGTGVYSAPIFAGVRRDIVDRRLKAMVRGVNAGHVAPWLAFNYEASIAADPEWTDPVLEIPLPDPDADARMKSYAERSQALVAQVKAERDAGFLITQERVNEIAGQLDVSPPTLAPAETAAVTLDIAPTDLAVVVKGDEVRRSRKLQPFGDDRGEKTIAQLRAEADAQAKAEPVAVDEPAPPADQPTEDA